MFREEDYPIKIPTYDKDQWTETEFKTSKEFIDFLLSIFKEPGEYNFNELSLKFREQASNFNEFGFYSKSPFKSKDFIKYWNDQKNKNRSGAIYKDDHNSWYLTRDYYMWLNFLPIFDKEKGIYDFPLIWDVQYHMALYEILAELHHEHSVILKKRQIASSYFHTAKLVNQYWFEEGAKLKMGASLKDYIDENGSWKMVQEYSDFLNEHTAWIRAHNPAKVMKWEQKIEVKLSSGQPVYKGLKSTMVGLSFEKSATKGVGGPCRYFFHEEAGIAPKMGDTYEFIRPALHSGMKTTGMFIAAGSVGDLDQCEPLKEYILYPKENGFYAVESNLLDEDGTWGTHGLFLPEQWSMPPCIDKYGNSLVEEALNQIDEQRKQWKKDLSPDKYQLRISQKPKNIAEAFAYRKESPFPLHLITEQTRRIEDKQYSIEYLDIAKGENNSIVIKESKKLPIQDFPVNKKTDDKTGCLVVWERPPKKPEWGVYYASIDPVSEGKTTTSESLCSIYVYKNPVEITRENENGELETFIERDKIVAAWCGRFDDINKTHERLELIIEYYNAWTLVENNISLFIQHMIAKRKQKYLVPKDQILFLKDLGSNRSVFSDYGWKNTGTLFKQHLISYAIEFLSEEIDVELNDDETTKNITYGIEKIPDIMLMKEMTAYYPGVNVDRLVSFAALVSFAKIQQSNRGYKKIREDLNDKNLEKSRNLFKLNSNPFKNIGRKRSGSFNKNKRNPFKNIK